MQDETITNLNVLNFNQALFDIFQNILCSDICRNETQEHIVSILCDFIKKYSSSIGTGWKPLFKAIKVRL